MDKNILRRELKKDRHALPVRRLDYEKISQKDYYKNAKTICVYMSFGDEISTGDFLRSAIEEKTVCIPHCTDAEGSMILCKITRESKFHEGMYGIWECDKITEIDKNDVDVIFVPGIAFDKNGVRIGYGKGYYDRFLADYKGRKVGVCHRELVFSDLPKDENDIEMDEVLGI